MKLSGQGSLYQLLSLLSALQFLAIAPPALCLPLIFKWGVEKGRILFLVMIGIVFGGSAALALGVEDGGSFSLPGNLSVWLLLGAIVLYALSWRLSIRLYRSREL